MGNYITIQATQRNQIFERFQQKSFRTKIPMALTFYGLKEEIPSMQDVEDNLHLCTWGNTCSFACMNVKYKYYFSIKLPPGTVFTLEDIKTRINGTNGIEFDLCVKIKDPQIYYNTVVRVLEDDNIVEKTAENTEYPILVRFLNSESDIFADAYPSVFLSHQLKIRNDVVEKV